MTRIYTKTGDAGQTSLLGGLRVPKYHRRVRAYGAIDELNAAVGVARAARPPAAVDAVLERVQHELFDLGAELAADPAAPVSAHLSTAGAAQVERLERDIDGAEAQLPPLRQFVLPAGTPAAAALHLARTVARRAEREIVRLSVEEPLNPELLKYVNRLSDLLFVLARACNHAAGQPDVAWRPSR